MRTIFSRAMLAGLAVLVLTTAAAAGGPSGLSAGVQAKDREASLDIALAQPGALRTGENQFEVTVKGVDGQPINGAVVSIVLTTSRLQARGWLWKEVKLTSTGRGMYMGSSTLPSAPKWETTIKVKKDGKKIGQKKFILATA